MESAIVYIFECCSELIRKYSQAGGNGKDNSVIVQRDILQRESGLEGVWWVFARIGLCRKVRSLFCAKSQPMTPLFELINPDDLGRHN